MRIYVTESEMKFGPLEETCFLHIEKNPYYGKIQKGMRICEFIYYDVQKENLISLEAKKTAPNPKSEQVENPKEKFREYIHQIREKFENSLDLYLHMALQKEVPEKFQEIDYHTVEVVFVLVIKNHQKEWLKDVNDALQVAVSKTIRTGKIWKSKVLVLNEELAGNYCLAE